MTLKKVKTTTFKYYKTLYFEETATTEQIVNYINQSIKNNEGLFNYNEEHSCVADFINDEIIYISGDEDYFELKISLLKPIKIIT